jgi:hypothetical protein
MTVTTGVSMELARQALAAAESAEASAEAASRLASAEREAGRATRGEEQAAKRLHMRSIDAHEAAKQRLRKIEREHSAERRAEAAAAAEQRAAVKHEAADLEAKIGEILAEFDDRITWIETEAARVNAELRGGLTVAIAPPSAYRIAFQHFQTGLGNLRAAFPEPARTAKDGDQ